MQTLSEIPELVRCFPYNPQPRPQGKSTSHLCQLVMELMEVCASTFAPFSGSPICHPCRDIQLWRHCSYGALPRCIK